MNAGARLPRPFLKFIGNVFNKLQYIPVIKMSDINNCDVEMSGLRQSRLHKKNTHRGVRVVSTLTYKYKNQCRLL